MKLPDDDRPHRKHCVCATCKADRDARYAALEAEAGIIPTPPRAPAPPPLAPVAPAPRPPAPAPIKRERKPREPYAETRVRDRRPRPKVQAPPRAPRPAPPARRVRPVIRKEDARCCMALVDAHGRPPIGYCGPDCERRPR